MSRVGNERREGMRLAKAFGIPVLLAHMIRVSKRLGCENGPGTALDEADGQKAGRRPVFGFGCNRACNKRCEAPSENLLQTRNR